MVLLLIHTVVLHRVLLSRMEAATSLATRLPMVAEIHLHAHSLMPAEHLLSVHFQARPELADIISPAMVLLMVLLTWQIRQEVLLLMFMHGQVLQVSHHLRRTTRSRTLHQLMPELIHSTSPLRLVVQATTRLQT